MANCKIHCQKNNLNKKYTSASRKRVTQEKLEHKSPLCICDTVELNTLFKTV